MQNSVTRIEANCIIVVADGRGQVFRRQPPASANACSRGLGWNIPKNTKGRDVSLLIKAVIAMARDIATAVDSAGLLPQAEEALAQVEE
jgi:hypothetical protein